MYQVAGCTAGEGNREEGSERGAGNLKKAGWQLCRVACCRRPATKARMHRLLHFKTACSSTIPLPPAGTPQPLAAEDTSWCQLASCGSLPAAPTSGQPLRLTPPALSSIARTAGVVITVAASSLVCRDGDGGASSMVRLAAPRPLVCPQAPKACSLLVVHRGHRARACLLAH